MSKNMKNIPVNENDENILFIGNEKNTNAIKHIHITQLGIGSDMNIVKNINF